MSLTSLIIYYLIFSFGGWIIDSTFCTIIFKKWTNSGYYKYLPLCLMYGFGGLGLLLIFHFLNSYNAYVNVIVGSFAVILIEYVGGAFCEVVLKEKLWDYSLSKAQLNGHIDLAHSVAWIFLVTISYAYVYPKFLEINKLVQQTINISTLMDFTIFILFTTTFIVLTAYTKKWRLAACKVALKALKSKTIRSKQ